MNVGLKAKNKLNVIYFNYVVHASSYKTKNDHVLFVLCDYLYQAKNKWSVIYILIRMCKFHPIDQN